MRTFVLWKRNDANERKRSTNEMTREFMKFVNQTGGKVKIVQSGWTMPSDGEYLPPEDLESFKVHDLHKSRDGTRIWGLGSTPGWNGWRYIQFFTVKRTKGEKDGTRH